ncbi:unnamed protein product [Fraxinus pennsylvanica]|uniref:Uncharacterized protein n=1 Tax=Fraxinus pennsylvanica TaxID=56036 RepID=A0AAD1Z0Z0_9LAMI|nr:unnamed protein product [Fraxinus pennsylvanica]
MLLVGIGRPAGWFLYPVYIFYACFLSIEPDYLDYLHTDMDFDLDEMLKSLPEPGNDEGFAPIDGKFWHGLLSFYIWGDDDLLSVPLKVKKTNDGGTLRHTIEEVPQLSDDPVEVIPPFEGTGGSQSSAMPEHEGSPLPDFRFSHSRGYLEMRVVRTLVTPKRVQSISYRSTDDIERVLAVDTERVSFFLHAL